MDLAVTLCFYIREAISRFLDVVMVFFLTFEIILQSPTLILLVLLSYTALVLVKNLPDCIFGHSRSFSLPLI